MEISAPNQRHQTDQFDKHPIKSQSQVIYAWILFHHLEMKNEILKI